MSITLNSQIHGSSYARQQQTMPVVVLCFGTKQGEHTLILRTDIKILSYFSNSWGYFYFTVTPYPSKHYNITDHFCQFQQLQ
jgi:hypothetical protein